MATNGIELPVSLQIKNLQEIANQLKQFANKNVLADSLGGKKIDSELGKILSRLEQVSAKAKTAFTTQSDFTSVQKDINQVELGLNRVRSTISNLGFGDLKIPDEFQGQITALQSRIRELNGSLATFKGTQKEKLISNSDFMADLQAADPGRAAKMLREGYDELYKAVSEGMDRVNAELALKAAEYKRQQEVITQNSSGKTSMTQWGALSFIQDAFKALPKDDKQKNSAQQLMSQFMKATENAQGKMEFSGFQKGALGLNRFLASLQQQFTFSDEQMAEIKARIRQQVQELSKEGQKATATDVITSMGKNSDFAKKILFGDNALNIELQAKQYATQVRDAQKMLADQVSAEKRAEAYSRVKVAFDIPNEEIKQKAAEIAAALKVPEDALRGFEDSILSAATKSPELAALFQRASAEVATLTNTVEQGKAKLQSIDNTINKMQGISNFINRYVGLYAIVRKVTQAIRNAMTNIKDIDKAITSIAVVTNMSQQDLWGKIGEYTQMAQQYGVATKDVYTVSQIFYQQGLQTSQVMQMTTESLKMAKIAGIDYSTAANAMTVAVRAFKMEMSEAQQVTDTYSALAAKFAVSSSEIANAMEKTASSAASVGMSLQSTSAFISVMEQTTRESAQNIGSALKSIISRYGEMKASPEKLLNVEGEEVAFNKVDTALSSIGISIKDASGQFRDFDDVIMELASKWNSLDNNTQRYIATIMAGNRQQSRFIALVSNYDELNRAMNTANNAENASIVQVAKTMDSLESKSNQLKNAFSQLYLDLHIEEGLKGAYDWLTRILKTIGKLGALKGVLPTLMNVIGFGTGAKSLVKGGVNWLQQKKGKYDVEVSEAQQKIDEVRAKAAEDIKTRWQLEADLSQLQVAQTQLQSQATATAASIVSSMKGANPNMTSTAAYDTLKQAYANGQLDDPTKRADFMRGMNIDPNSTAGAKMEALLQSFSALKTQAGQLGTTLDGVKNSEEQAKNATDSKTQSEEQAKAAIDSHAQSVNNSAVAQQTVTQADVDAAQQKYNNALKEQQAAQEEYDAHKRLGIALDETTLREKDRAASAALTELEDKKQALAKQEGTSATEQEKGARETNTGELNKNSGALNNNTNQRRKGSTIPSGQGEKTLTSWVGRETAQKWTGIGTGVARMAGTALVAAGAQHQDKSTDTVETSKILTGAGNALSMAGTGASMGMTFGPLGAAIGGLIGAAFGGLGAIIDGLHMDLSEKIALQKEEAQKAQDESLKAQAKATDISSQIDNLKQLQKAMYDSTDSMQAYKDAISNMAEQYPELVSAYDSAGNAIINITDAEEALSKARLEGASAAREAAIKQLEVAKSQLQSLDQGQYSELSSKLSSIKLYSTIVSQSKNSEDAINRLINSKDTEMSTIGYELSGPYRTNEEFKNYDYVHNVPASSGIISQVEKVKSWYEKNQSSLGLTEDFDAITQHTEGTKWTVEQLNNIVKYFDAQLNKAEKRVENLNSIANNAVSYETLLNSLDLDSTIKQDQKNQLETTKNYQGFFNELLSQAFKDKNKELAAQGQEQYGNLYDWQTAEGSDYVDVTQGLYDSFIAWYNGLGDNLKAEFANLDFTEYSNFTELVNKFSITEDLQQEFEQQFIKANAANRDRILSAIYETDENGDTVAHTVNSQMKGLESIGWYEAAGKYKQYDQHAEEGNYALDIAQMIGEQGNIISKYSDYFTTQLLDINNLAEEGYTELARTRLTTLHTLANQISSITDSKKQNDLFGIITNIDFSSYDSIQSAVKNMETYAEKNNIADITKDTELGGIYEALTSAANNLVFNVNTLAQELTTTITTAAKDMDSIVGTNKSGLTFDKALEEFTELQAQFSELTSFNQAFSYDAVLGKYVYTQQGLAKAIESQEQQLSQQVTQLTETAQLYTQEIATWDEEQQQYISTRALWGDNASFADTETLTAAMREQGIIQVDDSEQITQAYESIAADYIKTTTADERTWENFAKYISERAQSAKDTADAAIVLEREFEANKINQYYQAIDWSKLALGTDFTGTNKNLQKNLIEEINKRRAEAGKALLSLSADWETTINAYLEETYDTEEARNIAKTAIKGQIKQEKSQSISTAISEVLQGAGSAISEGTAAILEENGKLAGLVDESGVLKSAGDFVHSALELFNATKDQFTTVAERNKTYLEVIQAGFKQAQGVQTLASSGGTLDINSIGSVFDAFGLNLDTYYNQATNTWNKVQRGEGPVIDYSKIFKTDMFGNTEILDWDEMMQLVPDELKTEFAPGNPLYDEWYNAWVQGNLDRQNKGKSLPASAMASYMNAKEGESISIANMPKELKDALGLSGDTLENVSEQLRDNAIMQLDATSEEFNEETQRWIRESQKSIQSKRGTQASAAQSIIKDKVSRNEAEAFSMAFSGTTEHWQDMMESLGFTWDKNLQQFIADENVTADKIHQMIEANKDKWGTEQYNNALALEKNLSDLEKNKSLNAIRDLLSNYTDVSNEMIATFETQFPEIDVDQFITEVDGKKQLDISKLQEALQAFGINITELFTTEMSTIADKYVSNIEQASSLVSSGTTSVADMDTFTDSYNEILGLVGDEQKTAFDLFNYNEVLGTWTLDPVVLKSYVQAQADALQEAGQLDPDDVDAWVKAQTDKMLANNVNIDDFLSAEDKSETGEAYKQLAESMREYYTSVEGLDADLDEIDKTINDAIGDLKVGGADAVKVVQDWATKQGRTATAEEIESAFNSAINELSDAMDKLGELTVGQITTGKLREYLAKVGKVDSNGVVTSVSDMADVYQAIYDDMEKTAGRTTAGLNQAYAKVLTAGEQKDIDTLEALENASDMTYEALGDILAKYNIQLKDFMANSSANGIQKAGFGKVKITDWNAFANAVGLSEADMNTPEYMEAYNSWVESRTEFENNEKERVQSAVDELKGLTEATPESAINISHLEAVMGSSLSAIVEKYGATLNQGMLKLGANTNIPALIQDIADEAARARKMIPEQLAELADAVQGMLQQITSLIQGGIKGSLSNVDVVKLQNWATQSGLGKLDFQKTADGLKLSEKSAIQLYNKLKDIDGLQAKLVFDDLSESLKASNDNFKDTESLLAHVAKIRNGTYAADEKISTARKKQYEEELAIAEEILKVRSTQEDDSYKFMDKSIPAGQNNPLNYMQSWGKAYAAMKESTKGGKDTRNRMAYEDFYNLVTEMGHLADITGEAVSLGGKTLANSEEASKLITEAAANLRVTADGTMKVDLSKIGVNFQASAKDMNKSVDAGIDAVADAQIAMLDSMISLLEVVVAMEQLGDIDINGDNQLNIGEIFKLNGMPEDKAAGLAADTQTLSENYKTACKHIIDMATPDSDLESALKAVKVNGTTMYQIFKDASEGQVKVNMTVGEYQKLVNSFYQMALSDDYDLDNIAESIKKIFSSQKFSNLSIDVGNKTFYLSGNSEWVINWDNEEAINAAKEAIKDQFPDLVSGLDLTNNEDVRTLISRLIEERTKNGITAEEVLNIDLILGLASGKTQIKEITDKNGNGTGQFEGTYKNQTIQGSKTDVENAIKRAIKLENDGFNFKFTDDGKVEGQLNLNSGQITLTQNSLGKDEYIAKAPNGTTFTTSNKDDALGWLARQGYGDQGTYKFGNQTYNVFIDATTGLSYSINAETGEFICDNHHFKSYDQLQEYLAVKELGKGGISTYDSKTKIETIINGPATITYNHKTGEIKYTWTPPGGSPVEFTGANAKQAYEAYIAAWNQSGGQLDSNGNPMYNVNGAIVSVAYDSETGELTYTAHLANGKTVTAHDEESLMFGIAAETKLHGGTVSGDESKTYSYTVEAGGVKIKVEANDKTGAKTTVENAGEVGQKEAQEVAKQVKESADAELAATTVELDNPANTTVSNINVDLAEGGIVNANSIGAKIVEAINTYLAANPITAKILFGATASPGGDTGGDNTDNTPIPNPFSDIIESLGKIATTPIDDVKAAVDKIGESAKNISDTNIKNVKDASTNINSGPIQAVKDAANGISPTNAQLAKAAINNIKANITTETATATLKVRAMMTQAKGNMGAFAKGNVALASGTKTLMGELGPELVVSNGRYFMAGQHGAEFVDLAKDAIVFNHKQTERLMAQGGIGSRGVPFTNENNAISYAKGNVTGPAMADTPHYKFSAYWSATSNAIQSFDMASIKVGPSDAKGTGPALASASAALAALKQLRNMWQSLKDMTARDLAGLGGGGGGGGGGSNDKAFLARLDRWYNYLQKIATLEKAINLEEARRGRIASQYQKDGTKYYESQKRSLEALRDESDHYRNLLADQKDYFKQRVDESKADSNPFSALYHFDENGQIVYQPHAFANLSKIMGTDKYGNPNYNAKQQYEMIQKLGVKNIDQYLQYDSSGNKIEYSGGKPKDDAAYAAAVQAFWDKIEADRNEYQSLYDSMAESMNKIEELDTQRNEILQEYRDNQKTVEDKVLKAIEDSRQREIDALSDEREALEESTGKYIEGLSKALDKERSMYEQNSSEDELNRMMRQLGILQRSGGSASQIRDLQNQIQERQKEAYFDEQQRQIDAIQEASDLEIERLDNQIDIMTETLEYQKEMGLLWDDVYQVMNQSAIDIATFIGQDSSTWGDSPLAKDENFQQALFESQQWIAYRDDVHTIAEGVGTEETIEANPPNNSQGNYEATVQEPSNEPTAQSASKNGSAKATAKSKAKVTYKDASGNKITRYFDTKKEANAFAAEQKKNKKNKNVKVTEGTYYIWGKKTKTKKTAKIGPYMSEKLAKSDLTAQKKTHASDKRSAWKVAKTKPSGYAEGGYDYDTGLAMLHGTKTKPEAVFNATQTKILRENILSNKPNSLLSLLDTYNQAYKDGIGNITNNDSGITIENATVNMNVQQIANDYDAQRAGEQALAEMLRIARKSGSSNSVRR